MLGIYVAQLVHATQYIGLTQLGSLRIDHRIVGRRGFGQAGQHGYFCDAELAEILAEIDLRGGGKTVRALSEINVIDIKLKDFILAEIVFYLEGKQHFIKFARQDFFIGQKKIACHLHGDGAGTLLDSARSKIGISRSQDTDVIYSAVFVKSIIFCRQNGFFHQFRHFITFDQSAPFFTKLTQQCTFSAINSQWDLGAVISQGFQ